MHTAHRAPPDIADAALVADRTFILATRETGYRDVSAAVAELIDNALQAGARVVHVFVRDDATGNTTARPLGAAAQLTGATRGAGTPPPGARGATIAVLDDGHGMSAHTLHTALQFGGTERFDDRAGFGRFGMGLPNSSVSQTRRVDVYTWRDGAPCRHTHLDVDAVAEGRLRGIPHPVEDPLPAWAAPHAAASGTLVVWTRCDRLGRYRASTVAQRLRGPLGRIYRDALWDGLRLTINGESVAPVDPLFRRGPVSPTGAVAFGQPLTYEIATGQSGTPAVVEIRFVELPVAQWQGWSAADKRRAGIVGGAGVSVVRAGREIDYGWHLLGAKRRENYDDWWRCEVRFPPALDEWFGVTHSKQGITPTAELRAVLGPDLEHVARALNARARAAFERLKAAPAPSAAALTAAAEDRYLPPLRGGTVVGGAHGLAYRIAEASFAGPEFYHATLDDGAIVVTLNRDHPFFTALYRPACAAPQARERFALECLLLSAARADLDGAAGDERAWAQRLRRGWADALAAFLDAGVRR